MKTAILTGCLALILSAHLHAQIADFVCTDFRNADSVAALYPNHSLRDVKGLASKLTQCLPTEEEKFRAIYVWVTNNIGYDYDLYQRNEQKKEKLKTTDELAAWRQRFSMLVAKNLLEKQQTVCSGYAYLVRELAAAAGLSCVIVDGYGRNAMSNVGGPGRVNHSWNAVKLNNKWYLCDPTWSSGAYDQRQSRYVKKFDAAYFLPDPASFVRNHYPLDDSWTLLPDRPSLRNFLDRPLIYGGALQYDVHPLFPEAFNVAVIKGETISFRFNQSNKKVSETAEVSIEGPYATHSFCPPFQRDADGSYSFDYRFTTKGIHSVHLLLNKRYIFTYAVTVR